MVSLKDVVSLCHQLLEHTGKIQLFHLQWPITMRLLWWLHKDMILGLTDIHMTCEKKNTGWGKFKKICVSSWCTTKRQADWGCGDTPWHPEITHLSTHTQTPSPPITHTNKHRHTHPPVEETTASNTLPFWGPSSYLYSHSSNDWTASLWMCCCEAQCCSLLASRHNNKPSRRTTLAGWTANSQWKHRLFILVALVFQFMFSKWRRCRHANPSGVAALSCQFPFSCFTPCMYEQPGKLFKTLIYTSDLLKQLFYTTNYKTVIIPTFTGTNGSEWTDSGVKSLISGYTCIWFVYNAVGNNDLFESFSYYTD